MLEIIAMFGITYNHLNTLTTNSCNNNAKSSTNAYSTYVNNQKTLHFWKSYTHNPSNTLTAASDQSGPSNSKMYTNVHFFPTTFNKH